MYDKDILAKSTGASLGVVAIVGMLFLSSGMAFAMPLSGIGGFQVQSDYVTAEDFILYPGAADASDYDNPNTGESQYPMAVNELDNAYIEGLALIKEIDLSDSIGGQAAVVITAGSPVEANSLYLKTPALEADQAVFAGQTISEGDADGDVSEAFQLRADGFASNDTGVADTQILGDSLSDEVYLDSSVEGVDSQPIQSDRDETVYLENTNIQAHFLVADTLSLSDLGLEVWYDENGDDSYEIGGPGQTGTNEEPYDDPDRDFS